ncbi:MAG: hypothetical protein JO199_08115 [Candidatus Eremiobacteraeota bacterium]|nr:hypothetical protein [Candidatus Eremiobacteraeota bacterium]
MALHPVDSTPPTSLSESRREAFAALKTRLSAPLETTPITPVVGTALPELDRVLGGGFPSGALVVLEGNAGCWSLATRVVARVTQRALAAVIDDGGLYPPSLAQTGTRLDRVLVVPARSPLGIARAADILVRSRACRLVLMTAPDVRAAVWTRLAASAQRAGVLLIVIANGLAVAPLAAASSVRLLCTRERVIVAGFKGLWSTMAGYVVRAEVRKSRSHAPGATAGLRIVTDVCGETLRERIIPPRQRLARAALR